MFCIEFLEYPGPAERLLCTNMLNSCYYSGDAWLTTHRAPYRFTAAEDAKQLSEGDTRNMPNAAQRKQGEGLQRTLTLINEFQDALGKIHMSKV